jgi:hypothetical protein
MNQSMNPWSSDDEREHYPSVLEWWCAEGFFHSLTNEKRWCFKGSFTEWCTRSKEIGSTYDFTLFDLEKKKYYSFFLRNDTEKLAVSYDSDGKICVRFNHALLTGSYPRYSMNFENPSDQVFLELQFESESLPHWIAQDITSGYLPMGFGFFRYGFIPRNNLRGRLTVNEDVESVKGTGYYEHVWGDFSYKNPLSDFSLLKKSLSIYQKLMAWWIHHHSLRIPDSLKFFSENNPFGYDWVWGVLENGWSFFFGNILFWIAEGPVFGTLILTKDGENYQEFCNVSFKYKKLEQSNNYDFVYPSALEIIAKNDHEVIQFTCEMMLPCREFVTALNQKRWVAFVICEAPGRVTGTYSNKDGDIRFSGSCKIEPQRQISVFGHNALSIDVMKPPNGVGIRLDFSSHFLNKRLVSQLCFRPFPSFKFFHEKMKK